MIILVAGAAFAATLIGGLFALRFRDKLHLILGFSAGAVIGVAFFDLMPESLELGKSWYDVSTILTVMAIGFMAYLVLDRLIFLHAHTHDEGHEHELSPVESHTVHSGILGAASLSLHSFLDGIAIGLAFQASPTIGAIVTAAVLTHDFSDGINTVNLILKNEGGKKYAFRWLLIDAIAPVLGALSTLFFTLPEDSLAIVLALFSGFFLYIGATDLIPESHHAHPKFLTTAMTLIGAAVLYIAVRVAGL